jgi:hypothetical protein
MLRAEPDGVGQLGQGRRGIVTLVDQPADAAHQKDPGVSIVPIGSAPLAGSVPGTPGSFGQGEERDVLASRPSAGTGRSAVDAGRADSVDERTVEVRIASADGLPAVTIFHDATSHSSS